MSRPDKKFSAKTGVAEEGMRLDAFLAECPGISSRTGAQKLIAGGRVAVAGRARGKNYRLKLGDLISYEPQKEEAGHIEPQDLPLTIVYEDDDIIVVDKAAGMVVHPAAGHYSDTLVNALIARTQLASLGAPLRPGIVHRLDKGTSGLITAAKTDDAYYSLVRQLKERSMKREYIAIVMGGFDDRAGRVDAPVGRDPKNRIRMAVGGIGAKEALTEFEVIDSRGGVSLLRVRIETGRTHQIRVHMRFIGHPIVGDTTYGATIAGRPPSIDRQCLHAHRLRLEHPRDGREMEFNADIPNDMKAVIDKYDLAWE